MQESDKRSEASKENGKLGGVKSDAGKAVSSQNSLKHGILAHFVTKFDRIDLMSLYGDIAAEFGDSTPSRQVLIQQVALTVLRLMRCARAETEILEELLNPRIVETRSVFGDLPPLEEEVVVSKGNPATLTVQDLERLSVIYERYEPKLVSRLLRLLEALKEDSPKSGD